MKNWLVAAALFGVVCSAMPSRIEAQLFQGVALDDSSRQPVRRYPVALTRLLPTIASVVSRTRTDSRGLFQLNASKPGMYRLEFGDSASGITYGPVDTVVADTVILRQYAIRLPDPPRHVLLEYQVDEPVTRSPNAVVPRYPLALRERGVCGEVLAQFVVDTLGRAEAGSFRVLRSTDSLFTSAVRVAVEKSQYIPAMLRGRLVRQLVQQPFAFEISTRVTVTRTDDSRDPLPRDPFRATREAPLPPVDHPTCVKAR